MAKDKVKETLKQGKVERHYEKVDISVDKLLVKFAKSKYSTIILASVLLSIFVVGFTLGVTQEIPELPVVLPTLDVRG